MADTNFVLSATDQTQAAFNSVQQNLRNLANAASQARAAVGILIGSEVVQGLGAGAREIINTRLEYERLTNVLGQAVGVARIGAEFDFVRDQAQRLGLQFNSTAIEYARFAAATRGTAVEGTQTREIFVGLATASAAMGLSAEQSAGALNALQQMISKGKVSAEELRGQLGERLPGAFQIAARSMGVTTQELDRMLQQGELLASDFLPRFARQLQAEFGENAEAAAGKTQGALNRLSNAWDQWKRTVAQGPIGEATNAGLNALASRIGTIATETERAARGAENWLERLIALGGPLSGTRFLLQAEGLQRERQANREAFRRSEIEQMGGPQSGNLMREVDNASLAALSAAGGDAAFRRRQQELVQRWSALSAQVRTPGERLLADIQEARQLAATLGVDAGPIVAGLRRQAGAGAARSAESKAKQEAERRRREAEEEAKQIEEVRQRAMGFDPQFAENAQRLWRAYSEGPKEARLSLEQFSEAYLSLVQEQTAGGAVMKKADEERAEAAKASAEAMRRGIEEQRQEEASARASAAAVLERVQSLTFENDTAGYNAEGIERLTIARLEDRLAILQQSEASREQINALRQEIEYRRQLATQYGRRQVRTEEEERQKKIRDEASRTAQQTQQALSNAIFRAFQDGSFSAKEFANLLQATFAEVVLRPQLEIVSKGAGKLIEQFLPLVGNAIMGMATTTAPINTGGWISPEGATSTPTGGLWASLTESIGRAGKSAAFVPSAMPAAVDAAPSVSISNTYYVDAGASTQAMVEIGERSRQGAVSDVMRAMKSGALRS